MVVTRARGQDRISTNKQTQPDSEEANTLSLEFTVRVLSTQDSRRYMRPH